MNKGFRPDQELQSELSISSNTNLDLQDRDSTSNIDSSNVNVNLEGMATPIMSTTLNEDPVYVPAKKEGWFGTKNQLKHDNEENRVVPVNFDISNLNPDEISAGDFFCSNRIRTSKYTALTFLPKNLFEQFHRVSNIYFLIIAVLNWIPQLNVFLPIISIFPLLLVLAVTMIKDAYEDNGRRKSDKTINGSKCHLVKGGDKIVETLWMDLKVGDMVKILCDEQFPADLVVIKTSEPKGSCYVETMNLDGESNLKQRQAIDRFSQMPICGRIEWKHCL